ncbi:MAG: hypothetical protein IJT36_03220 [Alphaproteobacteria bacterium]|nr:hypothetical protein [Alphaproteobacteria bacterium]
MNIDIDKLGFKWLCGMEFLIIGIVCSILMFWYKDLDWFHSWIVGIITGIGIPSSISVIITMHKLIKSNKL